MSGVVSRGRAAGEQADALGAGQAGGAPRRGRRVVAGVSVLLVLGAGAAGAWYSGIFRSHGSGGSGAGLPAPATQSVVRRAAALAGLLPAIRAARLSPTQALWTL